MSISLDEIESHLKNFSLAVTEGVNFGVLMRYMGRILKTWESVRIPLKVIFLAVDPFNQVKS